VRGDRLGRALFVIGGLLALASVVVGLIVGLGDEWDSNRDRGLWLAFTLGGAAVLAGGLWYASRTRSPTAAALIVVGALMCGLATFWSIVMPLAAVAVAATAIVWARRPSVA
jgi:hypothetical protein